MSIFFSNMEVINYEIYKTFGFNDYHPLNQSKLSFLIPNLFIHSTLLLLISLAFPYHSNINFDFFNNLVVIYNYSSLQYSAHSQEIIISNDNLHEYLQLSTFGPFAHAITINSHQISPFSTQSLGVPHLTFMTLRLTLLFQMCVLFSTC